MLIDKYKMICDMLSKKKQSDIPVKSKVVSEKVTAFPLKREKK